MLYALSAYLLLGATSAVLSASVLTDFSLILRAGGRLFGRVALILDTVGRGGSFVGVS